jgi:nitroreductase
MLVASPLHQILDLARWAPSGDNTQPWRFEIIDNARFVIHGFDTRSHCVYDLDGRASQLSLGALIETIDIAASGFGRRAEFSRRSEMPETQPTFDVTLVVTASGTASRLLPAIPLRSVQRRRFSPTRLTDDEKSALARSLDDGYRLIWREGWVAKWRTALLMFANAKLRLTTEEAYKVHRDIIHWNRRYSPDRVPDQALGADAMTVKLMRWVMQDWRRVQFLNRYLAGTWMPRLQMDLLPSLMCGAHFVLLRHSPPTTVDDYVDAGRMVQRLWLTATSLGLLHQPELTPLIFSRFVRENIAFSASTQAVSMAARLTALSARLVGPDQLPNAVWIGRLGHAAQPAARSTRRDLETLMTLETGRKA